MGGYSSRRWGAPALRAEDDAPSAADRGRDELLRFVDVPFDGVRSARAWTRVLRGAAFFFFFIAMILGLERSRVQRAQGGAAEQMEMQVIDLLAAVGIAVQDESIAALGDAVLTRQVAGDDHHVSNQRLILVGDIVRGRNRLVRHDEDMYRGGGSDVQERNDPRIAEDDVCGQLPRYDFLEKRRHVERSGAVAARLAGSCWMPHCTIEHRTGVLGPMNDE